MNINVEKLNFEQLNIGEMRETCNEALDALWKSPWVRLSMEKQDMALAESINGLADEISAKCQIVVVVASGNLGRSIKAALSATEQADGHPEILVIGDSLSSFAYAQVITKLEEKSFVLVAIDEGEESLQFRSAFFTMKQLLIMKHGAVGAADRIYAVAGEKSQIIMQDSQDNDYGVLAYPKGIEGSLAANTAAVLLPLALKGGDIQEFLGGFYDLLSSPEWDLSGADYAIGRAAHAKGNGAGETLLIWQSQLLDFGRWEDAFDQSGRGRSRFMPEDECFDREDTFNTTLLIDEDQADIMTPSFEGCNEDGSLSLLTKDTAEKYFLQNNRKGPAVKIAIKRLNSYSLGQLMAFGQLSNGITAFLLNK